MILCWVGSEAACIYKRHRNRPARPTYSSLRFGHENISTAILPLPLIQEEHLSCSGEKCTLYTGKLFPQSMHRKSAVRITIRPDMTKAIYSGCKAKSIKQTQLMMITCPCNVYPLTPHFHIVKLGVYRGIHFFLFLL